MNKKQFLLMETYKPNLEKKKRNSKNSIPVPVTVQFSRHVSCSVLLLSQTLSLLGCTNFHVVTLLRVKYTMLRKKCNCKL